MNKVLGIGLNRTGTKSLNKALRQLGFNVHHYPSDSITAMEVVSGRPYSILERCDGLTDLHATVRFKELDEQYPGSKFIMTLRWHGTWLDSCRRHFEYYKANPDAQPIRSMSRTLHLKAYGADEYDEATFQAAYQRHSHEVAEHLGRQGPEKLLLLDVVGGQGWEKLCPFLGVPIPDRPFPVTR